MFSFSTEEIADLVKRIFTRSAPVSRTKVSSLMATTRPMTPPMDQHQCQREEQADIAFGRGSQKLHGAKSPLKNSDNAIIPSYQPCCKAKV